MNDGNIAEFDAPEVLHGQNGIFRAMYDPAALYHGSTGLVMYIKLINACAAWD